LLSQDAYYVEMRAAIATFFANNPVSAMLSLSAQHDALKTMIKSVSRAYDEVDKKRRTAAERALRGTLKRAGIAWHRRPSAASDAAFTAANHALKLHLLQDAQASHRRAEAVWQTYGERGTGLFHSMGRAEHVAAVLPALSAADGSQIDMSSFQGAMRACEHMTEYFSSNSQEGLFRVGTTDTAAQQQLLASVDATLSTEAAAACEGPCGDGTFTSAELLSALSATAPGKSSGTDGLTYEFWKKFWPELGCHLTDVLNEAFASSTTTLLPESMREGLIVLIYKGRGAKDKLASYRPITLLNSDVKIAAKAIVNRVAAALDTVIDPTQSAFIPGRWIGDNVLYHIHEIEYLDAAQLPGCTIFLDFEKAYDRQDRAWTMLCAERLGFGDGVRRWFQLLMSGTTGRVSFNGHRTDSFPINNGMAQGSPLSPILFIISAQPLTSHLRHLQHTGAVQGITLPDGSRGPPSLQHADDTTLHASTVEEAVTLLDGVRLYCNASNAKVNTTKSHGRVLGSHRALALGPGDVEPLTGVPFAAADVPIVHLGVPLCATATAQRAAASALFERMLQGIKAGTARWAVHELSYTGRVHIAKQELASTLYYHGAFVTFTKAQLDRADAVLRAFMRCSTVADDERATSLPASAVTVLPAADGGAGAPDISTQIECLQAKNIARMLQPQRHPWKVLGLELLRLHSPHLGAALVVHDQHGSLAGLPGRLRHALRCFRATRPHRVIAPEDLSYHDVLLEPLFGNQRVTRPGLTAALHPAAFPLISAAGKYRLGDLLAARDDALLGAEAVILLSCLPDAWRSTLLGTAPAPVWTLHAGAAMVYKLADGAQPHQLYSILDSGQLRASDLPVPPGAHQWGECLVVDCATPARPGETQAEPVWYIQGAVAALQLAPGAWGHSGRDFLHYHVSHTARRMLQLQCARTMPDYAIGASVRPRIWEDAPTSAAVAAAAPTPAAQAASGAAATTTAAPPPQALSSRERRQQQRYAERRERAAQAGPSRPSAATQWQGVLAVEATDPNARHLQPSTAGPRQHPVDRAAASADRRAAEALMGGGPAVDDAVDPAAPSPAGPWRSVWRRLQCPLLPRDVRHTCWLLLHGVLNCGAHRLRIPTAPHHEMHCLHHACTHDLETLSHLFLDCPAVSPAVDWLCAVVERVLGRRPPRSAQCLLVGDLQQWDPGDAAQRRLWTVLRCAFIRAVWVLRCTRGLTDPAAHFGPAAVAARTVSIVRSIISVQWRRVVLDLRPVEGQTTTDTRLSLQAFERQWCGGSSPLCQVATGRLSVLFSTTAPVPAPSAGPIGAEEDPPEEAELEV